MFSRAPRFSPIVGLLCAGVPCAFAIDPVPLDQLPKPVAEKLHANFAGADFVSAEKDERNDFIYFFVKIRQRDQVRKVTINEYGEISGVEAVPANKSRP
ncbi:MAG: hypothetical protein PHC88_08620 [Terrimicrobiaceae bacterium]|nr:hypothetical protein [Terrimicrobiaceae bacterium]